MSLKYHYVFGVCLMANLASISQSRAAVKIMPLGDSITAGFGSDDTGGYRLPLQKDLTSLGIQYQFVGSQTTHNPARLPAQPYHEGHDGYVAMVGTDLAATRTAPARLDPTWWNRDNTLRINRATGLPVVWSQSGQLYGQLTDTALKTYRPDIILLMIGTNDQLYDPNEFDPQLRGIVYSTLLNQIFSTEPGVTVIAAPIPYKPYSETNKQIDQVNAVYKSIVANFAASGDSITWVGDWTAAIGEGPSDLPDGIHPSTAKYTLMAQYWSSAIQSVLVPEPDTAALFGAAAATSLLRRSRKGIGLSDR